PRRTVEEISLPQRQMLESARAISRNPAILLLDEPTSSLAEKEVEWLWTHVRQLSSRGTAVVFTSHRWNEIRDMADRVTIYRNGADVGTFLEIDETDAITRMTGRSIGALYRSPPALPDDAAPVLEVQGLTTAGVKNTNLIVRKGEILGLGG